MKIAVTGSDGFIGRYLADYFKPIESEFDSEVVIHCLGRVPREGIEIKEFVESNIMKTIELVSRFKGRKIIYLSSMSVYDSTPYGVSKLMGELCVDEFKGEKIILRIPKIVEQDVPAAFIVNGGLHVAVTKPMGLKNLAEYIKGVL